MQSEFKFEGGRITIREKGQMFDSKSGKKTEWGKGLKILGGTKPITLEPVHVQTLVNILEDHPEIMTWLMTVDP